MKAFRYHPPCYGRSTIALAIALAGILTMPAQAEAQVASILSAATASVKDFAQAAEELIKALGQAGDLVQKWSHEVGCNIGKAQLLKVQGHLSKLAAAKMALASTAFRYMTNDGTVTYEMLASEISQVSAGTQSLVQQLNSDKLAVLFHSREVNPAYQKLLYTLMNGKDGLFDRMKSAARRVEELSRAGAPLSQPDPSPIVRRQAEMLEAEGTDVGTAATNIGGFIDTIKCD